VLTSWCGPGSPRVLRVSQRRVLAQQTLTGLIPVLVDHGTGTRARLANLDNLLQLVLSDLRTRQHEPPPLDDLLFLLALERHRALGRDKVGVRDVVLVLPRLLGLLLALVLLHILLTLCPVQVLEGLADGRAVLLGELLRRVVESRSRLLLEGNVGHVVCPTPASVSSNT
jgi:hypothetical protein